jgi:hypothetical protein
MTLMLLQLAFDNPFTITRTAIGTEAIALFLLLDTSSSTVAHFTHPARCLTFSTTIKSESLINRRRHVVMMGNRQPSELCHHQKSCSFLRLTLF